MAKRNAGETGGKLMMKIYFHTQQKIGKKTLTWADAYTDGAAGGLVLVGKIFPTGAFVDAGWSADRSLCDALNLEKAHFTDYFTAVLRLSEHAEKARRDAEPVKTLADIEAEQSDEWEAVGAPHEAHKARGRKS